MVALLALAVCGCANNTLKPVEENIYPADYRTQIVDRLRIQLENPSNIVDAYVAEPVLKTPQGTARYIACVRFNAKDRNGNYNGPRNMAAYFLSGKLTQIVDANAELCANAAFQPFPELQRPS